jgi:hypothetical protein
MKPRLPAFSSPSFALISVLALVSLAALTATAFLASARLERQATNSLGGTTRLEMACTSAKECASQTLNIMCEPKWQTVATYWRGTNTNDWTNELGYLLLGRPNSAANIRWTYFCGFNPAPHKRLDTNVFLVEGTNTNPGSYLTEIGSFMATMTNGFVTNPTSTDTNCTLIPLLGGRTSPPVGWTYIYQDKKIANSTNTTNVPVARFSYYMEDLSGLIDAERMGGSNRNTGTNASEISLTNLTTNWSSSSILNASNYTQFISPTNRSKYFSPGLMLYAGGLSTNDLRYFAHGLLSWTNFPNTIPVGVPINNSVGYSQGGQLKTNLNTSANLNVTSIADVITANLPGFTNRAGGFSNSAYVSAIAANIKDYIDSDSQPTFTNVAGVNVRGIEALPFINERVTLFNIIQTNAATVGTISGIMITIVTQDFYEFWNLASKPTPSSTVSIVASNNLSFTLGVPTFNFNSPTSATNSANQTVQNGTTTNSFVVPAMLPNAFYVTNSLAVTNYFFYPVATPPPAFPASYGGSQNFFKYYVYLGGVNSTNLYDQTLIGCYVSSSGSLPLNLNDASSANRRFFGSYSAFSAQTNIGTFRTTMGDPRIMFYLNDNQDQITYANGSSFGGRNLRANISSANNFYQVTPSLWPDGGHNSPAGAAAGTLMPTSVPLAAYTNIPPSRISDSSTFTNICELGSIFDPIQWRDPTFRTTSGFGSEPNGGQWTILTTNATPDNRFGGGTSLRIGRAEHPRFAFVKLKATDTYPVPNMGQSAVALLDIFSVSDSYDNGGKINLNTAPAPVLRALAGGVTLTNDSGMKPSSTLTVPNSMTEAFAQGVMRFRAVNPFLTPSQLAFIATDYGITNPTASHWTNTWPTNAVFGNTNPTIFLTNAPGNTLGTTASMGVSAWNDQASEEWFSKIYNLSTVQSWNYRTYVVAQLVNTNGLPTGPSMRKYSLMYIRYNNAFPTISASPFTSFESPY